jgi:AcrR family transcriptional regulator
VSPVKSRQQIAAEETQRVIVDAAAELFLERGYTATSVAQIAAAAGVAVQTIYNSVGSKSALLSRVLDHAAAGERAPAPVATFMREQAEAESDPGRILDQLVTFWATALSRTAPVFRVIRQAAATDPEAAALEAQRAAQRLRNYRIAAQLLRDRGGLRKDLSLDQAAAVIFAIGHPEAYRALVLEGSWSERRWSDWASSTLKAALLTRS